MVLCKSILRLRFFDSFSIFFPSQGLPAWIPRNLFCCALANTTARLSICQGGIALNYFCWHVVSRLRMSRSILSGSSSMWIGMFYSSLFGFCWILRARATSISMMDAWRALSWSLLSVDAEAGMMDRSEAESGAEDFGGGGEDVGGGFEVEGVEWWSSKSSWEVKIWKLFFMSGFLRTSRVIGDLLACFRLPMTFVNPSASLLVSGTGALDLRFKGQSLNRWPCSWLFLHWKGTWS